METLYDCEGMSPIIIQNRIADQAFSSAAILLFVI
jgi:hypothetical protein